MAFLLPRNTVFSFGNCFSVFLTFFVLKVISQAIPPAAGYIIVSVFT
jgi:hypothetical protein